MKNLPFFDAGCCIGDTMYSAGKNVQDLLQEMDRSGVERALINHAAANSVPLLANQCISEMVAEAPDRLRGTWTFLTDQCPELPPADQFFAEMKQKGIRALNFFPEEHHYVASPLSIGKIMGEAAERKIPILLEAFSNNNWKGLYEFLEKFPRNTYIFRQKFGKWGCDRQIRPLLEHYENFYFGLSGYWVMEGIYDLAERYGAERILFASGYPDFNMGNQMLQLKHSKLSAEDIEKIAGKNLENLLEGAEL